MDCVEFQKGNKDGVGVEELNLDESSQLCAG